MKRILQIGALLFAVQSARAEYLHIQLRVYGLDCEICARGVSASVGRLEGVENVSITLKTGIVDVTLKRGNNFKLSDLRKRIKENGFRSMEAKITARGTYNGSKFTVAGSGESYTVPGNHTSSDAGLAEATFDAK